jgi:predicted nucleic-acid-binding Zn-ribbon protein
MKATKECPKCGSSEIYTNENLNAKGERGLMPITSWNNIYLSAYVCLGCGYLEEYIAHEDFTNKKEIEKLRDKWKKVE